MRCYMEADAKLMKLWIITEKDDGNDYDIKKVADSNHEIIEYNSETGKITIKSGKQIQVFRTFKEAAIIAIGKKITKKKNTWDEMIASSYALSNEISQLMDSLESLRGTDND